MKAAKEYRLAKRTDESVFDRIYKHNQKPNSKVELTPLEKKIAERWNSAWLLLCKPKTPKTVAEELVALYGISLSIGYDDVRCAMKLYGDPRNQLREHKRAIAEQIALTKMQEADDRKDYEMSERYYNRWLEITGLKEHGADNGLAELVKKFRPQTIVMNFKAEDLREEAERMRQIFQDVDFEEVAE